MREVGDVLQPGLCEIAARDLTGALEEVTDRGGAPEALPVIQAPAEGMRDRRDEKRGIGHAPGDHHVGAGGERGHDGVGAEIRVGGDDLVLGQRRAARFDGPHRRLEQRHHVVAGDDRNLDAYVHFLGKRNDSAARGQRIRGPHVGHDANAASLRDRKERSEALLEERVVARRRVGELA